MQPNRLKRLAQEIDALVKKDNEIIRQSREIAGVRKQAALELHRVCASFVRQVNELLRNGVVELAPESYGPDSFKDTEPNLMQIHVRGRILQIEFESTPQLISTEDYRIPYTLQGAVRSFNQELLDRDVIEEQMLFYCVDKRENTWRFFDPRTYRTGPLDEEYLLTLMEKLI